MKYLSGILYLTIPELEAAGIQYDAVKKARQRRSPGWEFMRDPEDRRRLLVRFDTMRPRHKNRLMQYYGWPMMPDAGDFERLIVPDPQAQAWFSERLAGHRGIWTKVRTYTANAEVLAACLRYADTYGHGHNPWNRLARLVQGLDRERWPVQLPKTGRNLQKLADAFLEKGYEALLHGNTGNTNRRKRNEKLEYLIISLYVRGNKPYGEWVKKDYDAFLRGELQLFDIQTGEVFDHTDPAYKRISYTTVWRIITSPQYAGLIARLRDGRHAYSQRVRPHHIRRAPLYSLSKVSMDDRDIMHTRLKDGTRVKSYFAVDRLSGAMIGIAYSTKKDGALFLDMLRDMYGTLLAYDMPQPVEAEVENHLVRAFEADMSLVFPRIRWGNPANSQEKYAERAIRTKKYGPEKRHNRDVGRHYARLGANRVTREKIFDEDNNNYKYRTATFEEIVVQDMAEWHEYNHSLHPDQKRFPGKTRWEVLMENINPDAAPVNVPLVARLFGRKVETSIRRNSYVRALYGQYQLTDYAVLDRLESNNYKVDAYYLPAPDGQVPVMYLWQNGRYVGMVRKVEGYNSARGEWTEADRAEYERQARQLAKWDKRIKDQQAKVSRIGTYDVHHDSPEDTPADVVVGVMPEPEPPDEDYTDTGPDSLTDYAARAFNDL